MDYRILRFLFFVFTMFTVLYTRRPEIGLFEPFYTAVISGIIFEILMRLIADKLIYR
jgi:hypothetical protein